MKFIVEYKYKCIARTIQMNTVRIYNVITTVIFICLNNDILLLIIDS